MLDNYRQNRPVPLSPRRWQRRPQCARYRHSPSFLRLPSPPHPHDRAIKTLRCSLKPQSKHRMSVSLGLDSASGGMANGHSKVGGAVCFSPKSGHPISFVPPGFCTWPSTSPDLPSINLVPSRPSPAALQFIDDMPGKRRQLGHPSLLASPHLLEFSPACGPCRGGIAAVCDGVYVPWLGASLSAIHSFQPFSKYCGTP